MYVLMYIVYKKTTWAMCPGLESLELAIEFFGETTELRKYI